ncbi:MAG: glycosyltransferase [Microcoleaceae cyanobacterium]
MTVSVIIPVHNGGEKFHRCLASLAKTTQKPDELIVVADGDTDGSWCLAEDFGAQVIRVPQAGGPAKARNLGAKAATSDILFFVDADVEVHPNTIAQVITAFETESNLAALIGSYDEQPGAENFLSQYRNLLHHYTHQISSEEASTFWGACGAIRRDVFMELNGFNETYRLPSVEDIELGYRIKQAGYRIGLYKDIQVKHLKEWRPLSMLKADFFYRALPWTALILRNSQLNNDLNLQYSSRVSVALVGLMTVAGFMIPWFPSMVILICILSVLLFVINLSLYSFFYDQRGLLFTLRVIPWHWLYYFYSGLAFAVGWLRYRLEIMQIVATNQPNQL